MSRPRIAIQSGPQLTRLKRDWMVAPMVETRLSDTVLAFRVKRGEEFARQWRTNARRLQSLASNPTTPASVRTDALAEAREAAAIVAKRASEMADLAKLRGYSTWEADPVMGPLVVEIRAVENALNYAAEALGKA